MTSKPKWDKPSELRFTFDKEKKQFVFTNWKKPRRRR